VKPVKITKPNYAILVNIGNTISVPNCKGCKYSEIRLKCLACEQADEIDKEKNSPHYYSEIISPTKDIPFPQLDPRERAIWILHLANFSEIEIASQLFVSQQVVSYCIKRIKVKLTP